VPRKIIFDRDAEADAENARRWYASRNPVAAKRFLAAMRAAMQLVRESPERWAEFEPGLRRVLLRKFPYAVIYTVRPDHTLVLAVMRCSQHPDYWRGRPKGGPKSG
jgi:toxin ParE1/3/4